MTARFSRVALTLVSLAACSCVPWTIRPINDRNGDSAQNQPPFSAPSYVDSIWASKLLPHILASAVEWSVLWPALRSDPDASAARFGVREASGAAHFLVRASGRTLPSAAGLRPGLVAFDADPCDGRADFYLQTGPELRGTALRDAAGFIQFSQFTNQLQFADVANELNARAWRTVNARFDWRAAQGKPLMIHGAFTREPGATIEVVAVKIEQRGTR